MKEFLKKYKSLIIALIIFILVVLTILFFNYFGVVFFGEDLGNKYSKYRNKIYFYNNDKIRHREIIKDVDVKTFKVEKDYSKDKNHVYFKGEAIDSLDVKTFKKHGNNCSKGEYYSDKNNAYYISYNNNIVELKNIYLESNFLDCMEIEIKCVFPNESDCPYKIYKEIN